ncbi:hypothetical protein [Anaerococcus sp. AGMB09787]|uniref:hypothetical protein n=1 Tax=Anaerococcus sp. AGMB09787 TaxID=2922869 RepID=UPI001FAEAF30|nr:hypothetical protein [Anaerococcus sp. AGMB09787]
MKDLLFIRKIEADKGIDEVYPITFELGGTFEKDAAIKIFNKLEDMKVIESNRFTIRGNSLTIYIQAQNINKVVELLIKEGINIYGIYVVYGDSF